MKHSMVLIRVLTATVLFLLLAQANQWADTRTHLVLATGYRTFLLAVPLFIFFGIGSGMRWALGLGVVSLILAFFSFGSLSLGLFALSMAVSGYLCKFISSRSSQGAADNKVSLNIGSLASGLLIMLSANKSLLLALSVGALTVTFFLALKMDWKSIEKSIPRAPKKTAPLHKQWLRTCGWGLIGIAIGIKLTGVFTILPQYLILKTGGLPGWFGSLIMLNSLAVIVFQHRIMKFLDRHSSTMTNALSISAMTLLMLPAVLGAHLLLNAVAWVLLLTIGECALSRFDSLSIEDGYLFPKELMVGVGSFITVALSRNFPQQIYWSGFIGLLCFIVGMILTQSKRSEADSVAEQVLVAIAG